MMLGVPCIASDVGGTSSMMQDKKEGRLYEHTDTDMLSEIICDFFERKSEFGDMLENAGRHARESYDVEKNLKAYMEVYGAVGAECL